jgi:spore coat polysaccharide biosynthesis protein SpsF
VAARIGVPVHRGDRDDVLGRYSEAARRFGLDPVLRATADNPAVDVQSPGRIISALRATGADYLRERGLPLGTAVEGMTAEALHRAAELAADPYDREHVTTFILKRRDLFRVTEVDAPAPLRWPSLRLTVDTSEDLAWVRELFARAGSEDPSLAALIAASCRASEADLQTRNHGPFDASGFGPTSPAPVFDCPRSARASDVLTGEAPARARTFEAVETSMTPIYRTEVA